MQATDNNHKPAPTDSSKPPAPQAHDHDAIPTDLPKPSVLTLTIAGIVVILAFVGLFLLGWIPREHRIAEVEQSSTEANDAKPAVQIAQPKQMDKAADVVLPADARANQETSIFPRANGYLKTLKVDIGDHVAAGQLLAEIDAPDVDADLLAAKASVAQSQANLGKAQNDYEFAEATLTRYTGFAKSGGVTQQQLDEKQTAYTQAKSTLEAAKANVQAADAAVQRLTAQQGFEKVVAPFAGTIAARNYDIGALMSATNTTPGKELFRIADTATLRIFVNVPQPYVTSVKTGQKAFLEVRNFPGKEFTGIVTRSAGELDPASRTIRYEIDFDNSDGVLYAGMYAQVRLSLNDHPPMTVPTSALVFDSGGTKVWVVNDGQVHSKKVDVGRDFGTEIEIASGLEGNEQVVTNPGLKLADGAEVQVSDQGRLGGDNKSQQAAMAR